MKQNFLVIEDRKFADICSTNIKQMEALKLEIYADIVICHAITGFEFINHCKLPVLLVRLLIEAGFIRYVVIIIFVLKHLVSICLNCFTSLINNPRKLIKFLKRIFVNS